MSVAAARLPCCVPFCRRTRGPRKGDRYPIEEATEWLCADHWKLADVRLRRLRAKADRAVARAESEIEAINREGYEFALVHNGGVAEEIIARLGAAMARRRRKLRQAWHLWERCKRQAIERALSGGPLPCEDRGYLPRRRRVREGAP
jgi:hypothetical protein